MEDESKREEEAKKQIKIRKLQVMLGTEITDLDKLEQMHNQKVVEEKAQIKELQAKYEQETLLGISKKQEPGIL